MVQGFKTWGAVDMTPHTKRTFFLNFWLLFESSSCAGMQQSTCAASASDRLQVMDDFEYNTLGKKLKREDPLGQNV